MTAFVDRGAQHDVEAVEVKFSTHLVVDLGGDGLPGLEHGLGQITANEGEMRAATGSLTRHVSQLRLCAQPGTHRLPGIRFAVQINMDEWRAHHAADVGVAGAVEVALEEVLRDLLGTVLTPAFEDGFLAALLLVATVGGHQRMHGPAEPFVIKLCRLQTVEFIDRGWNGVRHAARRVGVRDS